MKNRPHYRRVTGSKINAFEIDANTKKSTFSERLVVQFIICGAIMALLLIINLIDTSLSNSIGAGVKEIIQDQITGEDLRQVVTNTSDTAKTIFGRPADDIDSDSFDLISDSWMYNEESSEVRAPETQNPPDFRIDEDILAQIQAESGGQ